MFNQANVDNRQRFLVRGRVIVATTSLQVELLSESLRDSYPLYSVNEIPLGLMLVFCVEVSGYLTFDKNSEVKITSQQEVFKSLYYDPTAFNLVRPADPEPQPSITNIDIVSVGGPSYQVDVQFNLSDGNVYSATLTPLFEYTVSTDINIRLVSNGIAIGKPWLGVSAYPDFGGPT